MNCWLTFRLRSTGAQFTQTSGSVCDRGLFLIALRNSIDVLEMGEECMPQTLPAGRVNRPRNVVVSAEGQR